MQARHALRQYHLLIMRTDAGFVWQIRYNRHAKPAKESAGTFSSSEAAEADGRKVLAAFEAKLADKPDD